MTQFADQVNISFISQLISGIQNSSKNYLSLLMVKLITSIIFKTRFQLEWLKFCYVILSPLGANFMGMALNLRITGVTFFHADFLLSSWKFHNFMFALL